MTTTFFPTGTPSQSASGNLVSTSSNGGTGDYVELTVDSLSSVSFSLVGTPVGAIVAFEATPDGSTWYAVKAYPGSTTNAGATTTTTAGVYNIACGGFKQIRARLTAITSGQFSVTAYGTVSDKHIIVKNDNPIDLNATVSISPSDAQFGVDGSGITPPTGGSGVRGWLSGIYKAVSTNGGGGTSSSVAVTNFPATQSVSAASLPLPTGAATSANQPALNTDGGALAHVTNFPSVQPVSASSLPLPSGAAQDGTDGTGITPPTGGAGIRGWLSGIYKAITGTVTVGGSVAVNNLPATQAVSAASLPLPSGAAQDGVDASGVTAPTGGVGIRGWLSGIYKTITGTITVSQSINGSALSASNPIPVYDAYQAASTITWSSSTPLNTAQTLTTQGYDTAIVTLVPSGTITAGAITFEVYDGYNWLPLKAARTDSYVTDTTFQISGGGTHSWQLSVAGYPQARARLSTAITGTGSISVVSIVSSAPDVSMVTVGLDPNQPLPAGTNSIGSVQIVNGFTPTGSSGPGTISAANTDQVILAANANRKTIWIQNQHASAVLYVYPGTAAWSGTALQGFTLQPSQVMVFDVATATSAFHAASATASCPYFVLEG